jgi:N-acetylmuramoyl-L-alanine amidase
MTPLRARAALLASAAMLLAACRPPATTAPPPADGPRPVFEPTIDASGGRLPLVPERYGTLAIDVVYPDEGQALTAADSNFIFGSVGTGAADLTINGQPVVVAANGAFLGFLAVPPNGVYDLVAKGGGRQVTARRTVRVPPTGAPFRELSITPGTVQPTGAITVREGEPVTVRFRAKPGATARLILPDGSSVPLVARGVMLRPEGFQQDVSSQPREFTEYAGTFIARSPLTTIRGTAPVMVAPLPANAGTATVELVLGRDTVRAPLEVSLGVLRAGEVRVGVAAGDRPDSTVIGQALPGTGTPYHWFFPVGTVFAVTGEHDGFYRVHLADDQDVWIDQKSLRLLPPGAVMPEGTVGTLRVVPQRDWVDLRLSTSDRLPHRVTVDGNTVTVEVYGARTRTNWAHYGPEDPFVRRLSWDQARSDVFAARLEVAEPVWGWKSFYAAGGTLVVRVRRPPRIDRAHPLAGRFIAVDAGHPPGGAIGPTRLTEADANLAVAKRLVRLLQQAGARVLETRPDTAAVALGARPLMAERANVELLVSLHNNAFPDGVNPFANNGTTAFYNAPQSLELARALQHELTAELGLRDLGIARADLALVRPTWFPSSLTETMFLMVPQQEAALRDPAVQERIARAHLRAIEAFLRSRASP